LIWGAERVYRKWRGGLSNHLTRACAAYALAESANIPGGAANENALKRLQSPAILHIASHGFFLRDQQLNEATPQRVRSASPLVPAGENPLLRSGLALAGANQRRWGEGEDGILTVLEAAQLDWGLDQVGGTAGESFGMNR